MTLRLASEDVCRTELRGERGWMECPESMSTVLSPKKKFQGEPEVSFFPRLKAARALQRREPVYSRRLRLEVKARKNATKEKNNLVFLFRSLEELLPRRDLQGELQQGHKVRDFKARFWWALTDRREEPPGPPCSCKRLLGVKLGALPSPSYSFRTEVLRASEDSLQVFLYADPEASECLSRALGGRPRYRVALSVTERNEACLNFVLLLRQETHPVVLEERATGSLQERGALRALEALDRVCGLAAALGLVMRLQDAPRAESALARLREELREEDRRKLEELEAALERLALPADLLGALEAAVRKEQALLAEASLPDALREREADVLKTFEEAMQENSRSLDRWVKSVQDRTDARIDGTTTFARQMERALRSRGLLLLGR
jgi:hypothetical protein